MQSAVILVLCFAALSSAQYQQPQAQQDPLFANQESIETLFYAIDSGDAGKVEEQVQKLKTANILNIHGNYPLHWAVRRGVVARCFYDSIGFTPLHWAAFRGIENCTDVLIQNGADVNILDQAGETTPLFWAAFTGNEAQVDLLLRYGADVTKGNPLSAAVFSGNDNIVDLLLKKGANVDSANSQGRTAIDLADEIIKSKSHSVVENTKSGLPENHVNANVERYQKIVELLKGYGASLSNNTVL